MATSADKEKALLALKDSELLEAISYWLSAYHWEIDGNGRKGKEEMKEIKRLAPQGIKVLANYLDCDIL